MSYNLTMEGTADDIKKVSSNKYSLTLRLGPKYNYVKSKKNNKFAVYLSRGKLFALIKKEEKEGEDFFVKNSYGNIEKDGTKYPVKIQSVNKAKKNTLTVVFSLMKVTTVLMNTKSELLYRNNFTIDNNETVSFENIEIKPFAIGTQYIVGTPNSTCRLDGRSNKQVSCWNLSQLSWQQKSDRETFQTMLFREDATGIYWPVCLNDTNGTTLELCHPRPEFPPSPPPPRKPDICDEMRFEIEGCQ